MLASAPKGLPFVLWTGITRNETILVESGEDNFDGSVSITAKELLAREPTPGWEFHTQSLRSSFMKSYSSGNNGAHSSSSTMAIESINWPSASKKKKRSKSSHYKAPRLKGAKFHVYERDNDGEYLVWVFACVYNPQNISKEAVQTFLTKLVTDTELHREKDFEWLYGPTLACQESFGPTLQHYMMQVSNLVKCSAIEQQIETAKLRMSKNIELLLERDAKLEDLNNEANKLQEMAVVFQKRAKEVKRLKMWQDAKHGMGMGLAITAGIAIVAVPPLVALL